MPKITVDFTNTEDRAVGVETGKHIAKIKSITKEEGTKAPYLKWVLQITSGKSKGLLINHITSLSPQALFNLRDTLVALGVKVPKAAVLIDPDKLVGGVIGIDVVMREYDGNTYPNVKKVYAVNSAPTAELSADDEPVIDLGDDTPAETTEEVVLDLE